MAEPTTETSTRPAADVVRGWTGHRLDEMSGGNVGRIEGAFVDEASGAPEWLLARMGRFGHYTLIPGRDAVEGVGRVWVPYTREHIRKAPKVNPNSPLTVATERELLAHYGIAVDAGRAAELAELNEGAVSARPA
jgi:hypothetical protein